MKWLWSFEKLSKIISYKKPEPDILSWAVERVCKLYPAEAGALAIRVIQNTSGEAVQEAAYFFLEHYEKRYLEDLENAYRKSSGEIAGTLSAVFANAGNANLITLFREKYGDNHKEDILGYMHSLVHVAGLKTEASKVMIESILNGLPEMREELFEIAGAVFEANLIAGVAVEQLLDICNRYPSLHPLYAILLTEIGNSCGELYEASDLVKVEGEDVGDKVLPEYLMHALEYIQERLADNNVKKLEAFFVKEEYETVVKVIYEQTQRLIREKKNIHGEDKYSEWLKGTGAPRKNIEAITAFHGIMAESPVDSKLMLSVASVYLFAPLLYLDSLVGRPIGAMDTETALECFLEDRDSVEEDAERVNILKGAGDRGKIIDACFHRLVEYADMAVGYRVVEFLCDAEVLDASIFKKLLGVLDGSPYLWGAVIPAVRELGLGAVEILTPLFEDLEEDDWRLEFLLEILGDLPMEKSVRVILENWESFWVGDKFKLLSKVRLLGDRRFIAPLKKDLKDGEFYDGEVFSFLCRLNGVRDSVLKRTEKETGNLQKQFRKRAKYLEEKDYRSFLKEPVFVELICRGCRRAYHYEVHKILLSDEPHDINILDTVICKHCGAVDHYEYDPYLETLVFQLVMEINRLEDLDPEEAESFIVVPAEIDTVDGEMMTAEEAVEYCREKLSRDPRNPALIVELAFWLLHAKRSEEALPLYEFVLKLDPMAVDAHLFLGSMAYKKGDVKGAYNFFKEAYRLKDDGNTYLMGSDPEEIKEVVFGNLADISLLLKKPIPEDVLDWMKAQE